MEYNLSKSEYWFMWCGIEKWCDVGELNNAPEEVSDYFNRPYHNLSQVEIVQSLLKLYSQGDIELLKFDDKGHRVEKKVPGIKEIELALDGKATLLWYLTLQGGEKWEYFSKPNWKFYFEWQSGKTEDTWEIISPNKTLVEAVFLQSFTWQEAVPIRGSEQWEKIENWKILNWKILPVVYKLSYYSDPESPRLLEIESSNPEHFFLLEQSEHWYEPYLW